MHGIIQAGFSPRPLEPVQVASVATLHVRAIRTNKMELPPADLLIIDEAHHCPAASYRAIIEAYPDAVLLGLTATPCRGDGRGRIVRTGANPNRHGRKGFRAVARGAPTIVFRTVGCRAARDGPPWASRIVSHVVSMRAPHALTCLHECT